jgi:hypothetical protein
MPPQQSQGLLDRLDQLFGFGAHRQGILDWRGNLVCARREVNAEPDALSERSSTGPLAIAR